MNWLSTVTTLPPNVLQALGTIAVGIILGGGAFVIGWLKKPMVQAEVSGRVALDPADRDLGYALVRSVRDLSQDLTDHGERLREHGAKLTGSRCNAPKRPRSPKVPS